MHLGLCVSIYFCFSYSVSKLSILSSVCLPVNEFCITQNAYWTNFWKLNHIFTAGEVYLEIFSGISICSVDQHAIIFALQIYIFIFWIYLSVHFGTVKNSEIFFFCSCDYWIYSWNNFDLFYCLVLLVCCNLLEYRSTSLAHNLKFKNAPKTYHFRAQFVGGKT